MEKTYKLSEINNSKFALFLLERYLLQPEKSSFAEVYADEQAVLDSGKVGYLFDNSKEFNYDLITNENADKISEFLNTCLTNFNKNDKTIKEFVINVVDICKDKDIKLMLNPDVYNAALKFYGIELDKDQKLRINHPVARKRAKKAGAGAAAFAGTVAGFLASALSVLSTGATHWLLTGDTVANVIGFGAVGALVGAPIGVGAWLGYKALNKHLHSVRKSDNKKINELSFENIEEVNAAVEKVFNNEATYNLHLEKKLKKLLSDKWQLSKRLQRKNNRDHWHGVYDYRNQLKANLKAEIVNAKTSFVNLVDEYLAEQIFTKKDKLENKIKEVINSGEIKVNYEAFTRLMSNVKTAEGDAYEKACNDLKINAANAEFLPKKAFKYIFGIKLIDKYAETDAVNRFEEKLELDKENGKNNPWENIDLHVKRRFNLNDADEKKSPRKMKEIRKWVNSFLTNTAVKPYEERFLNSLTDDNGDPLLMEYSTEHTRTTDVTDDEVETAKRFHKAGDEDYEFGPERTPEEEPEVEPEVKPEEENPDDNNENNKKPSLIKRIITKIKNGIKYFINGGNTTINSTDIDNVDNSTTVVDNSTDTNATNVDNSTTNNTNTNNTTNNNTTNNTTNNNTTNNTTTTIIVDKGADKDETKKTKKKPADTNKAEPETKSIIKVGYVDKDGKNRTKQYSIISISRTSIDLFNRTTKTFNWEEVLEASKTEETKKEFANKNKVHVELINELARLYKDRYEHTTESSAD